MKFIFDFDDVLFHNTKLFKEHMYQCLEKSGVPRDVAQAYYQEVREKEFSLKNFIITMFARQKVDGITVENVYQEIIAESENFVNVELVSLVKKLGKDNCYIITNGDYQFNQDKVFGSGLAPLFCAIFIVPGSKKEVIYDLCGKHKDEQVIFVDDKPKFIDDIDLHLCPNLKTILYDEQGLEKVTSILVQLSE